MQKQRLDVGDWLALLLVLAFPALCLLALVWGVVSMFLPAEYVPPLG